MCECFGNMCTCFYGVLYCLGLCIFILFMLLFNILSCIFLLCMYSYCYVCSVYSVFIVPAGTLTEGFPCFFLSCKANAKV